MSADADAFCLKDLSQRLVDNTVFDGGCHLISYIKRRKLATCIPHRHSEARIFRCESLLGNEAGRILRLSNKCSTGTADARWVNT